MNKPTVLIVEDDAAVRYTLRAILEDEGFAVREAADGEAGLEIVDAEPIDLVLTDLRMPKMDGMALLGELARIPGGPRAIMITAYGSERLAVEAMKQGALDYFSKPFEPAEIARVVRRNLETVRLSDENEALRAELKLHRHMVFDSAPMRKVAKMVERVAARDVTVLIQGESGTGKELVARAIVEGSPRKNAPYLRFNCASLPRELADAELFGHSRGAFTGADRARRGLFREADGGSLLLDEVAELELSTQSKLLRVLQEGELRPVGESRPTRVDVRILAATNQDLARAVAAGRFRQDLYYRLNVIEIGVPPLREREADIAPLAEFFATRYGERYGLPGARLSSALLSHLEKRVWPGNVRELENTIERLVALSESAVIDVEALWGGMETDSAFRHRLAPASKRSAHGPGQPALTLKQRVARFEKALIRETLERCHGNQSETARRLSISRTALIDKLKKYDLR
jgi:two-component system response regulator HydG